MPIPERPRWPSSDPRYSILRTDDGSCTLECNSTGDTFHSGCGAIAECDHVYVQNSGVANRLAAGQNTRVLEVGFGFGLAFLRTAALLRANDPATLIYVAIENNPLSGRLLSEVLQQLKTGTTALQGTVLDGFLKSYREIQFSRSKACPRVNLELSEYASVNLKLQFMDAEEAIEQLDADFFDAIYFDPFSPSSNVELWTTNVLRNALRVLRPNRKLVSYCVNSAVRRTLGEVGFLVDRVPGPAGGKREVLCATKPAQH